MQRRWRGVIGWLLVAGLESGLFEREALAERGCEEARKSGDRCRYEVCVLQGKGEKARAFLAEGVLKGVCAGRAEVAVQAARWATIADGWDQAIQFWEKAILWERDEEQRKEYKADQEAAKKRFQGLAAAGLGGKKRVFVQSLNGGRGDWVEEGLTTRIFFGTDSAEIGPEGKALLTTLAVTLKEKLKEGKGYKIVGHCDSRGGQAYNLPLSKKRAESVAAFLESQGLPRGAFKTEGKGMLQPLYSDATAEGRAKNRRVVFVLIEP